MKLPVNEVKLYFVKYFIYTVQQSTGNFTNYYDYSQS